VVGYYLPGPLAGIVSYGGQLAIEVDMTVHFWKSPMVVLPDWEELRGRKNLVE
jgi:hypothetical protein